MRQPQNGREIGRGKHRAAGIVWRIDDNGARPRGDLALNHLRRQPEIIGFVGLNKNAFAARILNNVFE